MNEPFEDKRIIIDEDWKTQVERERAEQRHTDGTEEAATSHGEYHDQLPQASFAFLVQSIVTQTFAALGQFPDPASNERTVSLPYAKLNIDLLEVLDQKTRGNLSTDELALLEDALHHCRMLYISIQESLQRQAGMPVGGDESIGKSKIIT